MRRWKKILLIAVLSPTLVVACYIAYLWATYIDETVTSGSAFGFEVGASQQQVLAGVRRLEDHPDAVVYVSHGPKAGDHFTVAALPSNLAQLQDHDQWDVLLDGEGRFFDTVRLTFRDGKLIEIHRHRKHFELP